MHGLPPDFDPGVFVGAELDAVSFSANTVHLAFGAELSLTISGPFSYVLSAGSARVAQEVPAGPRDLRVMHRGRLGTPASASRSRKAT